MVPSYVLMLLNLLNPVCNELAVLSTSVNPIRGYHAVQPAVDRWVMVAATSSNLCIVKFCFARCDLAVILA